MSIKTRRQRGVTLIELILFIVIVSVAVVGVLQVMQITTANSADPLRRKQALMIAEAYLEEVQLAKMSYCDPSSSAESIAAATSAGAPCTVAEGWGNETGARPYDNVNDYVSGPNVATAAFDVGGHLADANGDPLNLTGYSVLLTIVPEALGDLAPGGGGSDSGEVLRISVQVSFDGQTLTLDGYRTRYAPNTP